MKIRIVGAAIVQTASLNDSQAAKEFASLLPLTITLTDYASTEKVSDLPKRLSTEGSPAGFTPSAGDLAFYAPWGNLALFYKDYKYSHGLIKLGVIDGGGAAFRIDGPLRVTIEAIKP